MLFKNREQIDTAKIDYMMDKNDMVCYAIHIPY